MSLRLKTCGRAFFLAHQLNMDWFALGKWSRPPEVLEQGKPSKLGVIQPKIISFHEGAPFGDLESRNERSGNPFMGPEPSSTYGCRGEFVRLSHMIDRRAYFDGRTDNSTGVAVRLTRRLDTRHNI